MRIDGELQELSYGLKLDRYRNHSVELVVDRLKVKAEDLQRLQADRGRFPEARRQTTDGDGYRNRRRAPLQPTADGSRKRHIVSRACTTQFLVQLTSRRIPEVQRSRIRQYCGLRQNNPRRLQVNPRGRNHTAREIQEFLGFPANRGHLPYARHRHQEANTRPSGRSHGRNPRRHRRKARPAQ